MAVETAIAFTTLFLENDHFVALYERGLDFADNFGAFYNGSADFNFAVGVEQQDAVELDGLAFLYVAEVVYVQELAGLCLELLSLNLYNCVHYNKLRTNKLTRRAAFLKRRMALVPSPVRKNCPQKYTFSVK